MAENSPNLKVNVTADTSQFSKGMKAAKSDLKDFEKVSSSSLDAIGKVFGVNTGQITQMEGALRGLGAKMAAAGTAGASAFGNIAASVSGVAGAVAGVGIGALVLGFKDLVSEAENFKNTVAGANIEMATAAYIDTYKQVMHDFNSETGKSVAETESAFKKFRKTFHSNFMAFVKSGGFTLDDGTAIGRDQLKAIDEYSSKMDEANEKATKAAELANDLYKLSRDQSENMKEIARLDAQIAEQKRIAYDSTESLSTQYNALLKAQELISQKYALLIPLEQKRAEDMEKMNDLASSTTDQIDAANKQRVVAINLEKQENDELRTLSRRQSSIVRAIEAENAAREQMAQIRSDMARMLPQLDSSSLQGLTSVQNLPSLTIPVRIDQKDIIDISTQLESLTADMAATLGNDIGTLIGDLAGGEDAWHNFANSAISAFGDMAITVGKMAIATGTATLGIKAALESLNGYVAIAAGTGLVALGAAVKSGLSNVANGNYNTGSIGYSSTASYSAATSSSLIEQSDINVNVTGTLKASGSQLVAVINNDNKRRQHTT